MPFETCLIKNRNEKAIPALYKKNVNKNLTKKTYTLRVERAFCRHSLPAADSDDRSMTVGASMTIEAALVFPLVLFVWIAFIALTSVLRVHEAVQQSLTDAAFRLAIEAEKNGELVHGGWMTAAWLDLHELSDLETGGVQSVSEYNFSGSEILMDDQWIYIRVGYRVRLLEGMIPIPEISLKNQVCIRAWTGYAPGDYRSHFGRAEENVYVSEYGQVYHGDRMCSHIQLKIYMAAENEAKKYPPCEKCHRNGGDMCETYYVTEYGECYHSRLGCSGLKRSVKRMTINEAVAGGYGVCSRCGGGNE